MNPTSVATVAASVLAIADRCSKLWKELEALRPAFYPSGPTPRIGLPSVMPELESISRSLSSIARTLQTARDAGNGRHAYNAYTRKPTMLLDRLADTSSLLETLESELEVLSTEKSDPMLDDMDTYIAKAKEAMALKARCMSLSGSLGYHNITLKCEIDSAARRARAFRSGTMAPCALALASSRMAWLMAHYKHQKDGVAESQQQQQQQQQIQQIQQILPAHAEHHICGVLPRLYNFFFAGRPTVPDPQTLLLALALYTACTSAMFYLRRRDRHLDACIVGGVLVGAAGAFALGVGAERFLLAVAPGVFVCSVLFSMWLHDVWFQPTFARARGSSGGGGGGGDAEVGEAPLRISSYKLHACSVVD